MRESNWVLGWKKEGEVEALQRLLKRLLQKRFGPLSPALVERIDATTDTDRLDNALDQIDQLARVEDLPL